MSVVVGRWCAPVAFCAAVAAGCAAVPHPLRGERRASFFPLVPRSHWEYVVDRRAGAQRFRFLATVRPDEFVVADGRTCSIVDERYADVGESERFPILYCVEGGFLHRLMSLEYRGETLEDNGLRSGEAKFLPTDLGRADVWEGETHAYGLPDGSGFVVQQFHHATAESQEIVVPAGRFARCVRVETTAVHSATGADGSMVGPRITYYYSDWYAPDVGLVKTEQRNAEARVLATIELVGYEIPGKTGVP